MMSSETNGFTNGTISLPVVIDCTPMSSGVCVMGEAG